MIKKLQRNARNLAFAFRTGVTLRDKLILAWMLVKHIAVNRRWMTFSGKPTTIRAQHDGRTFTVQLRDNATDIIIFEDIFQQGCYKLPESSFANIVDAGANIGLASLYLSLAHPGADIVSFEPVEHAMCKRNAAHVFDFALGKTPGMVNILIDPNNSGGHRLEIYDSDPGLRRLEVPVHRLDQLIADGTIAAPDLLKIDAEGAECDILEGLGKHLETLRALVAEAQSHANHKWIIERLRAAGFTRIEERILHPDASLPSDAFSIIVAQR